MHAFMFQPRSVTSSSSPWRRYVLGAASHPPRPCLTVLAPKPLVHPRATTASMYHDTVSRDLRSIEKGVVLAF
jgi:hypothetical protein